MPRVAILNEKVMPYRVSIYNLLAKKYDVTLIHSAPIKNVSVALKTLAITPPRKFGPFYIHADNLLKLFNQYVAVIVQGDIKRLSLVAPAFRKQRVPIAFWTIGCMTYIS